jgi:class 3 adenylate cyclase/tetratricopeptide (TPR) repeat protein
LTTSPLAAYLPQDRLRALARSAELPGVCTGAALFSDISGFTSLTEALTRTSGQRRGVDELSRRINAVHQVLTDEVERWGGSVLALAGDGMTCWFDQGAGAAGDAVRCAAGCADAMQRAMARFDELLVKIGIAAGPALRLVAGDPTIQRIDLLAGATVALAVRAQGVAAAGEVVVNAAAAAALGADRLGAEVRDDSGQAYHRVVPAVEPALGTPARADDAEVPAVDTERLRSWVLPTVFERETASGGLFAVDLRPATALFVHLALGTDPAMAADGAELVATVARVQRTLWSHGGVLLEVSVDADGTCCYGSFGAAQVHEDDAQRALHAALELRRQLAEAGVAARLGLASGTLCVGGYGGNRRRSFGAIGDAVNAAARVMALAKPGEVLVAGRVRQPLVDDEFTFEARAPIAVKGKAEPLPVFAVTGLQRRRSIRLQEPVTALPIVGREPETAQLAQAIAAARSGHGQLLRIVAEAGMGKSRLLTEAIRIARRGGLIGYGGACRASGVSTPYFVWQGVWTAWFDIDPTLPPRRQRQAAQAVLALHAPEHADAWPLLGAVLGQDWADTPLTAALQPKDRKALLHTMLRRCWLAAAAEAAEDGMGLLVALDDLHAADALSLELLAELTRDLDAQPVLVLAAERRTAGEPDPLQGLPHAQRIELRSLGLDDVEHIVRAKLSQRFPERQGPLPRALLEHIAARAQGNPFFVEELLDYLHDRGLDPGNEGAVQALELPASLHSLVLSRIDALSTAQQNILKAASVMGREVAVAELQGYCPTLGSAAQVAADLGELDRQGFMPAVPDAAEPRHVFRHPMTREVAYESVGGDTRAQLHGQYATYLEARSPPAEAPLLAHHFVQAERVLGRAKACLYLRRAGEQAAARFANDEALAHFERGLAWLPEDDSLARFELLVQRQALFDLQAERERQQQDLDALQHLAARLPDATARRAQVAVLRARLDTELGRYASARVHAQDALALLDGDAGGASPALPVEARLQLAQVMLLSGAASAARPLLDSALALAREQGIVAARATALSGIAHLHWQLGDYAACEQGLTEALQLARQGSPWRVQLNLLNDLGAVAQARSRLGDAARRYEEATQIARRIGDRSGEAMLLNNLGSASLVGGHFDRARQHAEQAARLFAETGETVLHAQALANTAEAYRELGQLGPAQAMSEKALALLQAAGSRPGVALVLENLGLIEGAAGRPDAGLARLHDAVAVAREIGSLAREASALVHLGQLQTVQGSLADAAASLDAAQALMPSLDNPPLALELDAAQAQRLDALGAADASARLEPLLPHLLAEPEADAPCLPIALYTTAWQVLKAAGDPRTAAVAHSSRRELMARAERIPDAEARRDFLAVAEHRWILTEPTDDR